MAGRVKVFLSHFWRPDDPIEVEEAVIRDWVSVLHVYRTGDVDAAMVEYLANPDRSEAGKAIRPGPWSIVAIIGRNRAREAATQRRKMEASRGPEEKPKRDIVSLERRLEIMAEIGMSELPAVGSAE